MNQFYKNHQNKKLIGFRVFAFAIIYSLTYTLTGQINIKDLKSLIPGQAIIWTEVQNEAGSFHVIAKSEDIDPRLILYKIINSEKGIYITDSSELNYSGLGPFIDDITVDFVDEVKYIIIRSHTSVLGNSGSDLYIHAINLVTHEIQSVFFMTQNYWTDMKLSKLSKDICANTSLLNLMLWHAHFSPSYKKVDYNDNILKQWYSNNFIAFNSNEGEFKITFVETNRSQIPTDYESIENDLYQVYYTNFKGGGIYLFDKLKSKYYLIWILHGSEWPDLKFVGNKYLYSPNFVIALELMKVHKQN